MENFTPSELVYAVFGWLNCIDVIPDANMAAGLAEAWNKANGFEPPTTNQIASKFKWPEL